MKGLTLLELIIVLTIILAVSVIFGANLFDFEGIRTRNNADKIVSSINEALSRSTTEKKSFGLIADIRNKRLILVELKQAVQMPCDQSQRLACDFTKMYIPAAADLLALIQNYEELPEDRVRVVSEDRIPFIDTDDRVYILVFDHLKVTGDFSQTYSLNGRSISISVNPVLRIAKLN